MEANFVAGAAIVINHGKRLPVMPNRRIYAKSPRPVVPLWFIKESKLRLSLYTDYSIRLLMYLAAAPATRRVNTREVATAYGISAHHLQKTVLGLARMGYVETLPGRGGGLRLARPAQEIRLGALVAASEDTGCLVDCGRGPCPLAGRCILKGVLDEAERVFIRELDKMTLADIVARSTGAALRQMISPPSLAAVPAG